MSRGWIIAAALFFCVSCFGGGFLYAKFFATRAHLELKR